MSGAAGRTAALANDLATRLNALSGDYAADFKGA